MRLAKHYSSSTAKERTRWSKEIINLVLSRPAKMANVLEWGDRKLIFKRYASLFFITCADADDNELLTLEIVVDNLELLTLEIIHHYVEILDRYFGNVCELDLIFNFHKAQYILDELLIAGELQEPSKKAVLRMTQAQDSMMEDPNNARLDN